MQGPVAHIYVRLVAVRFFVIEAEVLDTCRYAILLNIPDIWNNQL